MADNVELNAGSGGATVATDQAVGGEHYQYVKVTFGADNTQTKVDSSNPLPVTQSGVATAANQTTGNTTLGSIDTSISALAGDIGDTADAAATAGSTGTLHAKQRLMTSQLGDIKTAVEILDNAVAGSEFQVDVVTSALPTGAATAANQTTIIGHLDGVEGLLTTIDTDTGNIAADIAPVSDAAATIGTTPILRVAVFNDADTQITSFGGAGGSGTEYTEDAAAAANPVGGALIMVRADALAGVTSADGDNVAARGTDKGELYVKHADAVTIQDGGNTITVDGTVAVTHAALTELASAIDTEVQCDIVAALPAGDNNIGNVDLASAIPAGTNNIGDVDIASIAAGDNNIGNVDIVTMPNVTLAAGTNTNEVVGDAAHDAAQAGNPLSMGATAETSLSGITLVADGDATRLYAGVDGVLITRPHCNLEDIVSGVDSDTAGDSTAVIAAQGAGIKVYVTSVIVKNTHASTDAYIDLRDGAAGTIKASIPAPAAGGAIVNFDVPLPFSANTAVCVDPSAAVTTIITTVIGFKSKV